MEAQVYIRHITSRPVPQLPGFAPGLYLQAQSTPNMTPVMPSVYLRVLGTIPHEALFVLLILVVLDLSIGEDVEVLRFLLEYHAEVMP